MAAPGLPARTEDRLEIVGSKASARARRRRASSPRAGAAARDASTSSADYQASFDGAIRHFVDCLASGAAFETDVARQSRDAAPGRGCLCRRRRGVGTARPERQPMNDQRPRSADPRPNSTRPRCSSTSTSWRRTSRGSPRPAARTASAGGRTSRARRRRRSSARSWPPARSASPAPSSARPRSWRPPASATS